MIPVRLIININSKICLFFGGFLNFLLIWLVFCRTPDEMRSYSKIVLQTCFCDLANLLLGDIVQPLLFIYNGLAVAVTCGIAGRLPWPWNSLAYCVWIFFAFFAILGIIVQFLYRYLVVCRDWKIGNKGYFGMLGAVAVGLGLYFIWLEVLAFPPPDGIVEDPFVAELLGHNLTEVQQTLMNHFHMEEVPPEIRLSMRGQGGGTSWLIWHVGFITVTLTMYACISYLGREMVLFTRRNMVKEMRKNMDLQKQLTLNLILQAIIPIAALLGWVVCTYACIFMDSGPYFNLFTSLWAEPTQNWTSVLNPLVTILTIKPYRRVIFGRILGRTPIGNLVNPNSHGICYNNNNAGLPRNSHGFDAVIFLTKFAIKVAIALFAAFYKIKFVFPISIEGIFSFN